jgi:hypothetical protein
MSNIVERDVIIALAVAILISGCSRRQQTPPVADQSIVLPAAAPVEAVEGPPPELVQLGQAAESIFTAALTSKWDDAGSSVQTLKESSAALNVAALKPDLVAQMRSRVANLEGHVNARQRIQTMDVANGLTYVVAELSSPYQADVPYRVVLLGYYGRQLELGLATQRLSALRQTTGELRQTWNAVEPSIERQGHIDDARRFTDIVSRLDGATRPADFVAPVQAELAAVDGLEKVFTSAH